MTKNKVASQELRKRFNKEMEWRYDGATIRENGKLVMREGKLIGADGEKWWKSVCKRAWKTKGRHMEDLSLQPVIESYKYFKKHWKVEDEENQDL